MAREARDGDFVLVHLSLWDADGGDLIYTTDEAVARESGDYDEDRIYEPVLIILGRGKFFPELESQIVGMKPGDTKEIILEPREAFGERDESKVRTIPLGRLKRAGLGDVFPGDRIKMGGETGTILSISGGRVKVDFNHPLAGRRIRARVTLLSVLEDTGEKVRALTADVFGVPIDRVTAEFLDGTAVVEIPPAAYMRRDALDRKIRIASVMMNRLKEVEKLRFVETFQLPGEGSEVEDAGSGEEPSGGTETGAEERGGGGESQPSD